MSIAGAFGHLVQHELGHLEVVLGLEHEVDERVSCFLVLRGLHHGHDVGEQVAALARNDELHVLVGGVVAPAVPRVDHRRAPVVEPGVEVGIVELQQRVLGVDRELLRLIDLGRILGVDRVPQAEQRGLQQPSLRAEHRHLALQVGGGVQQVVPAVDLGVHQVGSVAQTRGAPGVRNRVHVPRVEGELGGFGIQVLEVRDLSVIELGRPARVDQRLQVVPGGHDHVVARAIGGLQLAQHVLVRGELRDRNVDTGLGGEVF